MAIHHSRSNRASIAVGLLLPAALIVIWLANVSSEAAHAAGEAPSARKGSEIFQRRCIACHNKQPDDDAPFGPPNLYAAFRARPSLSAREAESIIRKGKENMPAFEGILSTSEIRSVIAYLRAR